MKAFKTIIISYTAFMMAMLGMVLIFFQRMTLSVESVASYDAQELIIYKQVWEQINLNFQKTRSEAILYACVIWMVIFAAGYLLFLVIYLFLIKPVREMENFATEIAKGNLDVPIPMHRQNLFGSFTESFDLMREELRNAKERERAAENAKREMVGELSHDLKTPVATIQATCEVMELKCRRKLKKAQAELQAMQEELQTTQEEAQAACEEARDVQKELQLEQEKDRCRKIEADIKELEENLEKISYITKKADTINQLVGNVFRATLEDMQEIKVEPTENDSRMIEGFFHNLKEYGNIILENPIPECLVCFDKLRMEQVIDNVVGNSYKYAGTDIHVTFMETESLPNQTGSQNKYIQITIRDEGPGVSEEELPLIAQKYYRGKNSRDKQGYGLGLYLVKWYMEKQGGGMEYRNDHGFVVELWVKKV